MGDFFLEAWICFWKQCSDETDFQYTIAWVLARWSFWTLKFHTPPIIMEVENGALEDVWLVSKCIFHFHGITKNFPFDT